MKHRFNSYYSINTCIYAAKCLQCIDNTIYSTTTLNKYYSTEDAYDNIDEMHLINHILSSSKNITQFCSKMPFS